MAATNSTLLNFCTRCGGQVKPYPPSYIDIQGAIDYGRVPAGMDESPHYWCSRCGEHLLATNLFETGATCVCCGGFAPLRVRFCPHCGVEQRPLVGSG